jgi:hypothetical protein
MVFDERTLARALNGYITKEQNIIVCDNLIPLPYYENEYCDTCVCSIDLKECDEQCRELIK